MSSRSSPSHGALPFSHLMRTKKGEAEKNGSLTLLKILLLKAEKRQPFRVSDFF